MNRKQRVAVVVGVVVIVLLVLFPPYEVPTDAESPEFRWLHPDPSRIVIQLITSEPPMRLAEVARQRTVKVDARGHWSGMLPHPSETIIDAEGNKTVRYLEPTMVEKQVTVFVTIGVPYTVSAPILALAVATALTVAAVVVLKERTG